MTHLQKRDPSNCRRFGRHLVAPAFRHARDSLARRGRCSAFLQRADAISQAETIMSAGALELQVPDAFVQAIAERVAELLTDSLAGGSTPEPWIGVEQAAEHLACPLSRIYDLVSQRRLTPRRDGRRLLFKRSHLDAAIEALS
jgi:excisionase family DNA binding protein